MMTLINTEFYDRPIPIYANETQLHNLKKLSDVRELRLVWNTV